MAAEHDAFVGELGDGDDIGWFTISIFTLYAIAQVNIAILIYGSVVEGAIPPPNHDAFIGKLSDGADVSWVAISIFTLHTVVYTIA